jgi:hypothetical protein
MDTGAGALGPTSVTPLLRAGPNLGLRLSE